MEAKENLLRAIKHNKPEWVPLGGENIFRIKPPLHERPVDAGPDCFGVKWSYEEGAEGGTYPAHNGHTITDLSKWREQISFPDIDRLDWKSTKEETASADKKKDLVSGFIEMGLFERSYLLLGMQEALMAYVTEPDEIEKLISAIADYKIKLIERFDEEVPLDMIWYGDDWGSQSGLLIPPDTWRRIIKPHTKRIYDCMKKRDIIINQHSCGKIEEIFGDMVEIGADMWNPCQPCNGLKALKIKYSGKIAFFGAIDSQFVLAKPGVTVEEVRAEARKRIDELAGNGGYIAAPSHGVPYAQDIVDAMNDEIRKYGRKFYAGKG